MYAYSRPSVTAGFDSLDSTNWRLKILGARGFQKVPESKTQIYYKDVYCIYANEMMCRHNLLWPI